MSNWLDRGIPAQMKSRVTTLGYVGQADIPDFKKAGRLIYAPNYVYPVLRPQAGWLPLGSDIYGSDAKTPCGVDIKER